LNVAGPVTSAGGKIYEMLGCSSGYQITVTIGKPDDRISVPDRVRLF